MNLYEINLGLQKITNEIIEADGVVSDEQLNNLENLELSLKDKCINIAYVVQNLEADTKQIDEEIKRLQQLKKVRKNTADRLKEAVKDSMISNDIEEFKTSTHIIKFRKSESVNILDENKIPAEFKVIKSEIKIDKIGLKKALKNGDVSGAELSQNKNLTIK